MTFSWNLIWISCFEHRLNVGISIHGPAVTLNIEHSSATSGSYDVDLTLALKVPEWPRIAKVWKMRRRRGKGKLKV